MAMYDSILESVKLFCLVPQETKIYDAQLITFINSELNTVKELGVGPLKGYSIADDSSTWADLEVEEPLISSVETYVKISVKLLFDPPQNSYLVNLIEKQRDEAIWRITNDYSSVEE